MKWTLFPESEEVSTGLPMHLEISEWDGNVEVHLERVGQLKLKPAQDKLRTEFYFTLPGEYKLEIRDSKTAAGFILTVKEHQYLDFSSEFGFFLVLFVFVMGGIILWTKKIMKR